MSKPNQIESVKINKNAYFMGHCGLGDHINFIGAINYLSNFYQKIYCICFNGYINNLKAIFNGIISNGSNIEFISTTKDDFESFLRNINDDNDILVAGGWRNIISSKITNPHLINKIQHISQSDASQYDVPWSFIKEFYSHVNLNLSFFYEYFYIESCKEARDMYDKIKNYNIIFLHFNSHIGQTTYPVNEWPWIFKEEYFIVDPHCNHYKMTPDSLKYKLADQLLNFPFLCYLDIILNASQLYTVDSSFGALIHILKKLKIVNGRVIIYDRHYPNSKQFTPVPLFFGESEDFRTKIIT
jgi:hypothetical protein